MGSGRFDETRYAAFSASTVGRSTKEIYSSNSMTGLLNPYGVKIRESRDSADNPVSTPLIVALDVTGSMGIIADVIAREGLGTLFKSVLDRKPISDPHLMFMGVGDATCDRAPLQISQFEADNRIVDQLTQIYLEHGGGGNAFESYNLPWYFAAYHTVHDSYVKRSKRGYLFTIGDEEAPADLTSEQIKRVFGDDTQGISTRNALSAAQVTYDVFHIVIKEGNHARTNLPAVLSGWQELLGQRVIALDNYKNLAETIVSAIEVAEGADASDSAKRWAGVASEVVFDAVKGLPKGDRPGASA